MDISLEVNPSKRAYSIQAQSAAKQTEKTATTTQTDRLALSRQAIAYLEENNRRIQEQEKSEQENDGDVTSDGGASDLLDTLGEAMKEMEKCNKIAASIMKGKRVPLEDLRYLMEHDIKGYQLAMAMRKPEKDERQEKSVLDDEDRQGESTESAGTTASVESTASCESSGESGGSSSEGGETAAE